MEEVLHSYPNSQSNPPAAKPVFAKTVSSQDSPSWTAPSSRTDPSNIADAFIKPSLPYPLSAVFTLVENHQDYPMSCARLGELLKKLSGSHPADEVLSQAIMSRFPRVWMERFLFILLEVQPSDWQTGMYVLQFRHVKRLLLRVERQKPLNIAESHLARELIQALGLSGFQDFEPFAKHAAEIFKSIQSGKVPLSSDLGLIVYLMRCETLSMAERKNWLEGDLCGEGNPDTVARLTPHLKLLEDRIQKSTELSQRLGGYGPVQDGPLGLEQAMGPIFFAHLKEYLAKHDDLAGLKEAFDAQQAKRVPTRDLIALSTLHRWLMESKGAPGGPLDWVRAALESYDRGRFRMDISGGVSAVEILLSEAKVERDGNVVEGHFGENPFTSWIARDGLTRPFRSSNPDRIPPDLRALVMANLHRDTIILKLLDNARVFQTQGLVESIVEGSRSTLVHAKIATRRELHSGPTNGRVPSALLRSPVSIPSALLRTLIHPSYVSFTEMKSLYRGRSALRQEVTQELHHFLKQAYAL